MIPNWRRGFSVRPAALIQPSGSALPGSARYSVRTIKSASCAANSSIMRARRSPPPRRIFQVRIFISTGPASPTRLPDFHLLEARIPVCRDDLLAAREADGDPCPVSAGPYCLRLCDARLWLHLGCREELVCSQRAGPNSGWRVFCSEPGRRVPTCEVFRQQNMRDAIRP